MILADLISVSRYKSFIFLVFHLFSDRILNFLQQRVTLKTKINKIEKVSRKEKETKSFITKAKTS